MTKVLFIGHTYFEWLNRRKIWEVAKIAGENGRKFDVTAVVPEKWKGPLRNERPMEPGKYDEGYKLHPLPVSNVGSLYGFEFIGLDRVIREFRPDVIHIEEEPVSRAMYRAVNFARKYAPNAVISMFTWENLDQKCSFFTRRRRKFILEQIEGIVAGNSEADGLMRSFGFRGKSLVQGQIGVDTDFYKPVDSSALRKRLGLNGFVVGYLGRLIESKGLLHLLDAFSRLQFEASMLMVGRGVLKDIFVKKASDKGLLDKIKMIDSVPGEEVVPYLNCFDVLVLPSLTTPIWKEQFGHVIIEAMACGVPVIGSDSGAIPEVIGNAGLVFPEGDAGELLKQLILIHGNEKLRNGLIDAGIKRVSEIYLHSKMAAKLGEFWGELLS